ENAGRAHLDFAMFGDPCVHAAEHASDGFRVDLRVGLHRAQPRQFGGAVYLLQIDAEGAEEPEDIDAERCAPGVDDAGAAQPELVAHRTIDEELADPAPQTQPGRYRPALTDTQLRPFGNSAEKIKDAPLCRGRIGG